MASVNIISLLGRVGRDPEVRTVGDKKVANLTIATTDTWKDKSGEKKESTQWHNCVAWGNTAEIIEKYVHKGDQLYVSGKLVYEQYERDDVKHTVAKIRVDQVVLLGGKKSESVNQENASAQTIEPEPDNDLPF